MVLVYKGFTLYPPFYPFWVNKINYIKDSYSSNLYYFRACLLSYFGSAFSESWIDGWEINGSDFGTIYLFSLYTTLVTFVTVGYGDVTPRTRYI